MFYNNNSIHSFTNLGGLAPLFNGILTAGGYLMPKPSLKNSSDTDSWEDKGLHALPNDICPKVKVMAWQEFDLVSFKAEIQPLRYGNSLRVCVCVCACVCSYIHIHESKLIIIKKVEIKSRG